MSNGRRHVLGLLTGLVATGAIAGGLMYSVDQQAQAGRHCGVGPGMTVACEPTAPEHWTAVSLIVAAGLVIALLSGSRLSPLASLLPGLVFAAIGGIRAAAPGWTGDHTLLDALPASLQMGYQSHAHSGLFLMIGVVLVGASLFPSRWHARVTKAAGRHSFDYESPPAAVPVHEYGPPALRYGDRGFAPGAGQNFGPGGRAPEQPAAVGHPHAEPGRPIWEPGRPAWESGRPGSEPEHPGWAAPPPGPPPFNSP